MKKLVILGSGFAGFSLIKRIDKKYYDVTLISPRNHFLFTPLLPSTTVGTIEFRSIIEPIRNIRGIKYYQAYCTDINFGDNIVLCKDNDIHISFTLNYDILVIAVGEVTNTYNIPGVDKYACFLRELSDARKIRQKVIECFENASLPYKNSQSGSNYLRFIICGGGPTGVEFAAELHDFLEEDVKKKYPESVDKTEIILIEATDKILNSFDEKLSNYTLRHFSTKNIKVMINSYISKVSEKYIYLRNGKHLSYSLLVWTAGNSPNMLISKIIRDLNFSDSKITVDSCLKVKGLNNVYALGDCSQHEFYRYPSTGQTAQQQGKYLAVQLNKIACGKSPSPFRFRDLGMLAYIGGRQSLANTPQYKGSGFFIWLFWRSVYITKLVSLKNKILVLFDWFKKLLFGRDISNF